MAREDLSKGGYVVLTKGYLLVGFVALVAAVLVGWLTGSVALGVIVAVVAAVAIFYLAWERRTLGQDAGQRENRDEPGTVPHSGVTVHRGDGYGDGGGAGGF